MSVKFAAVQMNSTDATGGVTATRSGADEPPPHAAAVKTSTNHAGALKIVFIFFFPRGQTLSGELLFEVTISPQHVEIPNINYYVNVDTANCRRMATDTMFVLLVRSMHLWCEIVRQLRIEATQPDL